MTRFNGEVAIVTGAGSGIGREIALVLAAQGARVLAVDRNRQGADDTCRQARGTMKASVVELTDPGAPATVLAHCADAFDSPVSILVNNAGVGNARAAHLHWSG